MKELPVLQLLKALTLKRIVNALQVAVSYLISAILRKPIVWGKPFVLTVEPTNRCNLNCPQCSTGSGRSSRSRGDLSLSVFQRFIEETSPFAIHMLLYDQGEPFLHGQFFDFIRIAKTKRLCVTTSTNGHYLNSEKVRKQLIDSGLDTLIVSIDGATQETYSMYRRGGSLKKVVEGVKQLLQMRQMLGRTTPLVFVQFVVMKHNEHEIPHIHQLAHELGVDRVLIKSAYVDSAEAAREFLPSNTRYRRYRIRGTSIELCNRSHRACRRLWFSSVVHWDGAVVPCCFDKDNRYTLGNISKQRFSNIWKSHTYQQFRQRILHNNGTIDICNNCTEGSKIYF
jgi:radical SAM protein with 4Fe4S-binding SPASM domain